MDDLQRFVENDAFARYLGIELLEYGEGSARASMHVDPHHLNSAGILHGGAIFSLADAVFSAASNSRGALAVAINVGISFFAAVRGGTLTAEAREISMNPRLGTYLMEIRDESGSLIAQMQGTVYRKKERIGELGGT